MPALLTTPSSLPKLSIAVLTILVAGIASATVSKFATAVPPRFLISSTTSSAGVALDPEPSAAPPGSLTTTLAPSAAQSSAISRPMPRPAPVTMMDLPSSDLLCAIVVSRCSNYSRHSGAREARTRNLEIPGLRQVAHPGMTAFELVRWRPSLRRQLKFSKLESRRDGASDQRPVAAALGSLPGLRRHDCLRYFARGEIGP